MSPDKKNKVIPTEYYAFLYVVLKTPGLTWRCLSLFRIIFGMRIDGKYRSTWSILLFRRLTRCLSYADYGNRNVVQGKFERKSL